MKLPVIRGTIDRRILLNYHVDPKVLAGQLPSPFRPKQIRGMGLMGICLIRLKGVRPNFVPFRMGLASENAAYRAAVEWDVGGTIRDGVFIWRRDTSSRLNNIAGGRIFPGVQHHARFTVCETAETYEIALRSDDGKNRLSMQARASNRLHSSSIFKNLQEASDFFRTGALGYSTTSDATRFQGLELRCTEWVVSSLDIEHAYSTFFDDELRFPKRSLGLDCALLMRGVEHQWHGQSDLCCPQAKEVSSS